MAIKTVAVYVRASTKGQSVDMQLDDLERYSKERVVYSGSIKTTVSPVQRKPDRHSVN